MSPACITNNLNYISSDHNMMTHSETHQSIEIKRCCLELTKKNFITLVMRCRALLRVNTFV